MSWDELAEAFEAGTVDNAGFTHEKHVHDTRILAERYPRDEALAKLIAGIQGIAGRAGRPGVYHETITRAWFELIAGADDLEKHPELFDKGLLSRYYSTERLAAGRREWLGPDLHPLQLPPPAASKIDIRGVFQRVPTAVAVLAAQSGHDVHATTVSSITSVSREPALVSVCLSNESHALDLVRESKTFALSVLAFDQDALAARFGDGDRPAGAAQFDGVPHHLSACGPVIDMATAWIGCGLHDMHQVGDHHLVIGEVRLAEATDRRPLVRHDGAYH